MTTIDKKALLQRIRSELDEDDAEVLQREWQNYQNADTASEREKAYEIVAGLMFDLMSEVCV